jgi:hypothetical protein
MKLASDALKHLLGRMVCHSPRFSATAISMHGFYTTAAFSNLKVGERIYVISFPLGLVNSIAQGIVSSSCSDAFQFDALISSGNSGSFASAGVADRDRRRSSGTVFGRTGTWGALGKNYLLPDSFGNVQKCPRSVQASYPERDDETT